MRRMRHESESARRPEPGRRRSWPAACPRRSGPSSPARRGTKRSGSLWRLLALLVVAAGFGIYRLFFAQEERIAVTGTTTYGALNEAIQGSGTTTPADSVTYEISGKVLEWYVEAGQEVQAGDLLYVLDSSDAEDEMLEYEVDLEDLYEQRAEIQESIANQQVTAPFSGRIEDIQVEAGDDVQTGMTLATLVDDSAMKATLYFSYVYEDEMYVGMPVTVSVPDQMLTLDGTVTDIRYVDYVTAEGMKCFAVTVEAENPGSLTEGMTGHLLGPGQRRDLPLRRERRGAGVRPRRHPHRRGQRRADGGEPGGLSAGIRRGDPVRHRRLGVRDPAGDGGEADRELREEHRRPPGGDRHRVHPLLPTSTAPWSPPTTPPTA